MIMADGIAHDRRRPQLLPVLVDTWEHNIALKCWHSCVR
jgi:hypothetical protein